MDKPTILTVSLLIPIILIGGFNWYKDKNSYWSDGTQKVSRKDAEKTIFDDWANDRTKRSKKGGKKTKRYIWKT